MFKIKIRLTEFGIFLFPKRDNDNDINYILIKNKSYNEVSWSSGSMKSLLELIEVAQLLVDGLAVNTFKKCNIEDVSYHLHGYDIEYERY